MTKAGDKQKASAKEKRNLAKRHDNAISLEVKETKHRETNKLEHAKRRGVSMPTTTTNLRNETQNMQRTENRLTPKQKKQLVNAKPKTGLENLTEHRKWHNKNRQREDKYRISSPRVSGGGACYGPTFASGGVGWILRFPGLVVKQLELALDRAEEEELGQPWEAGGSGISRVAKGERVPREPTVKIATT